MKQNYILILMFILATSMTLAIKPGEIIETDYENITDVSGHCELINGSVYATADAPVGDNDCEIIYYGYYEETETTSSGSNGRSNCYVKCGNWTTCKKGNITRTCTICSKTIAQNLSCKIGSSIGIATTIPISLETNITQETAPKETQQEDSKDLINNTDTEQKTTDATILNIPPQRIKTIIWVFIVCGMIVVIGAVIWWRVYYNNY